MLSEQKCREFIKSDLWDATARCEVIINGMNELDLNDIDWQLDQVIRHLETAKTRLKNCEDY
jgi:hypothetical protein